jgi:hypothetical protein
MTKWILRIASFLFVLVVSLLMLFPNHNARAAMLCVNPGGTGGCYASIQTAVDAALPEDTIQIATGTYTTTADPQTDFHVLRIKSNAITLQGMGPKTIIAAMISNEQNNVTISNLVIQPISSEPWGIGNFGELTLRNITIYGNIWGIYVFSGKINGYNLSVYSHEGVVCNMYTPGTIAITNSVITTLARYHPGNCTNTLLTNDTFIGIISPGGSVITATNTIFAGGCSTFPYNQYMNSLGHNIDAGNNCNLNASGDMTNTNPLLTPSVTVNNVLINTLQPNSPAVDAGDDFQCPTTDATGFMRPYGARCDVGAYEWRPMNFSFWFFPFASK